jgi:hypothetical protein
MELMSENIYTVYRIDFLNNKKVPIWRLVERRQKERRNNEDGMLRLAHEYMQTLPSINYT